jgi:hypothetical protein
MPSIWQRHPRYAILAVVFIFCTFYLFYPQRRSASKPIYIFKENTLSNRLERSDSIYAKALDARRGMIKKFGPAPKDITLYVQGTHQQRGMLKLIP